MSDRGMFDGDLVASLSSHNPTLTAVFLAVWILVGAMLLIDRLVKARR